jgi:proteasome lid subunit RPN8/RPN11
MENRKLRHVLHIHPESTKKIEEDASEIFPDECCGFLFGNESGGIRYISEAQTVVNQKEGDKRRRFEIQPVDYMRAERYADENGLLLLGVYHSHPLHPSIPSEHDRVAAVPFFSYVITSVFPGQDQVIRSWRLNDSEQFEEEEIIHKIV